jgi:acyl-CoA thioester hydrolase
VTNNTFESEAVIRFPDCDPFNHLNNARYLDYFMNAREDHLMRGMDFNIYQVAQAQGISWVVGRNQIAYLRPAMLWKQS